MNESLLGILRISLPLTIMVSMFAQGLSMTPAQLMFFKERPLLLLRSLVVVLVVIPMAALGIILLLQPSPAVGVGLAILVASPAGPMMLVRVAKQGGSLAYMASLHLSLALLAVFTVPITLYLFSRALGFPIEVGEFAVGKVVGLTILLPVGAGVLMRTFFPRSADWSGPTLARAGGIALNVSVLLVVTLTYRLLLRIDPWSYFVMAAVVVVSLAIGHCLGPRETGERTALTLEGANRHPGLAMTIATLKFSPLQTMQVLIPYLVVFFIMTTVYLQWRKRCAPI